MNFFIQSLGTNFHIVIHILLLCFSFLWLQVNVIFTKTSLEVKIKFSLNCYGSILIVCLRLHVSHWGIQSVV